MDTYEDGGIHPSVVVVPTALAVAEPQGKVSGRELINAVALGVDLANRMGRATKFAKPNLAEGGWHFSALYGYFSAADTAGKLLGLDEGQMVNALGIGYHQAAGNLQCLVDGAMTKRMGPGFAARGGITSALLAGKGITGSQNSLEGERGIYNLYHGGLDQDKLTAKLGQVFEGVNVSFKPFPCCRLNHSYVDATLRLVADKDIKSEEVAEIVIGIHPRTEDLLCRPLEVKQKPRNIIDCQFSLPWSVACAVVRRKVSLAEFTLNALEDIAIKEMALKVKPFTDNSLTDLHMPGKVSIKTKSRGIFERQEIAILGSPKNPMSPEALTGKFRDCAANALRPLPEAKVDKIIDFVGNLEKASNVSQIFELLA